MTAHALGSARGIPYLGEFPGAKTMVNNDRGWSSPCVVGVCYTYYLLTSNWTVGCPTSCQTCLWGVNEQKFYFNPKDPYNTTYAYAPANYTDSTQWSGVCTESLAKLGLFEYTDETQSIFRLPIEIAMLSGEGLVSAMTHYTERGDYDKEYVVDFAGAYSKHLEMGVPDDQLYEVYEVDGTTPPFEGNN